MAGSASKVTSLRNDQMTRFFDAKGDALKVVFDYQPKNQQPTTNNQQPTTNNQQPTTNNQLDASGEALEVDLDLPFPTTDF